MNKNKNLYKLDEVFIVISYLMIIPLLYVFRPVLPFIIDDAENAREILTQFALSRIVIISILLGSLIFLQLLGRLIRKEEKVLAEILDIVVMYKTISINQLQHTLDMNQTKIEKYIKKLSNIGHLNIGFDGTYVKLQLNTGTDSNYRVSTEKNPADDFSSPPPIPETSLYSQQEENKKSHTTMGASTEQTISSKEDLQNFLGNIKRKQTPGKKFNVVLFIVLFFAFWPIAFIYAAGYYMKSQKGKVIEESLKNRLKNMQS